MTNTSESSPRQMRKVVKRIHQLTIFYCLFLRIKEKVSPSRWLQSCITFVALTLFVISRNSKFLNQSPKKIGPVYGITWTKATKLRQLVNKFKVVIVQTLDQNEQNTINFQAEDTWIYRGRIVNIIDEILFILRDLLGTKERLKSYLLYA